MLLATYYTNVPMECDCTLRIFDTERRSENHRIKVPLNQAKSVIIAYEQAFGKEIAVLDPERGIVRPTDI